MGLSLGSVPGGERLTVCAEDNAPSLSGGECSFGPVPDHLALVFAKYRAHLQKQSVGLWHVGAADFDIGVEKLGNEGQGPRQPIKSGNQQGGFGPPAMRQRLCELRPVGFRSALGLRVFGDDRPAGLEGVAPNCFLLSFYAESRPFLASS